MPKLSCLDCGIPTNGSRCLACLTFIASVTPRERLSPTQRGYSYAWRKVRIKILERDRWTCHYCQKILQDSDATVDHLVPLSKDGAQLDPSNLVAACRSCNSRKKDK